MSRVFLAAAALAAVVTAAPAYAAETFAQVMQNDQTDTLFLTNNGDGTGSLQSYAGSIVAFGFPTSLNPFLQSQDAYFTLNADITQPAMSMSGVFVQPVSSGDFSFIRTTPLGGLSNLLTVHFTNAVLTGLANGTTPSFLGSQPGGSATVSFTSDFLDFSGSNDRGFSFSLSGVNPALTLGAGGVLNSFSGDTTATFSVDAARQTGGIPEPSSWMLLIFGFGGAGALLRARRRRGVAFA